MELEKDGFIDDLYRWAKAYKDSIISLSYSKNTLELYNRAIDMFIEYSLLYQEEMSLKDIKSAYITGYLGFLEENAKLRSKSIKNGSYLSKSTKTTYLKVIKNLFTFISDNNDELFTFERYFKNIKVSDSSKSEEKLIFLTTEEINRLLEQLNTTRRKKSDYNSYRNSLLVKLMLFAGLRISEALDIKLSDFEAVENNNMYSIKIQAKGNKIQKGFILKSHIDEELSYLSEVFLVKPKDLIMVTKSNKQLNRQNAYLIVNRIYKKAKIQKEGLHLLRHTFAMQLTKKGISPIVIQKVLRHSNIATTTIYAKATQETVLDALMS